jgi:hypothetical protein
MKRQTLCIRTCSRLQEVLLGTASSPDKCAVPGSQPLLLSHRTETPRSNDKWQRVTTATKRLCSLFVTLRYQLSCAINSPCSPRSLITLPCEMWPADSATAILRCEASSSDITACDVSEDTSAFIFRVKESKKKRRLFDLWWWLQ